MLNEGFLSQTKTSMRNLRRDMLNKLKDAQKAGLPEDAAKKLKQEVFMINLFLNISLTSKRG